MNIGDRILYRRKRQIHSWEVTDISPSMQYLEVVNDDWNEHWIHVSDVLEVIESEDEPIPADDFDIEAVVEAARQPIGRLGSTKDYVRAGPAEDRFHSNEI